MECEEMNVQLAYKRVVFSLAFEKPCVIPKNADFVLRSVLGKERRSMCCVVRQNSCKTCMMKYTCIYSWFFESPVEKTDGKNGPGMASHPFVPGLSETYLAEREYSTLHYAITLVGKGISYLPYIYYSLVKAGEKGLFRERIRFSIKDIVCENKSILLSPEELDTHSGERVFSLVPVDHAKNVTRYAVSIDFITPFRFKKQGSYESEIFAHDLLLACFRRFHGLVSLYSEQLDTEEALAGLFKLEDLKNRIIQEKSDLYWREQVYFSSRQKRAMKLGGILGTLQFAADLYPFELQLLEAGALFHIGKNTSFGLGSIEVKYEEA
jgi:hypothetical protein